MDRSTGGHGLFQGPVNRQTQYHNDDDDDGDEDDNEMANTSV